MCIRCLAAVVLLASGAASSLAAGRVENVARDWNVSGMRRLGFVGATASSSFGEGTPYAPSRAVDGQRGSKWVATDQPSPEQPQWITLELFGSQEVSAVAVFGEAINNDGIQDAQVQVAGSKPGEFTTVATVEGATSASWLATFEPVKTTAVRLLVTRSGGPSTHTDVYEIEVFGRILPAAELKPKRHEELAASRQAARRAATGVNVISAREGTKLRLTNDRVSVVLDEAEGSWDATWLGGMDATVRRVRFGVEVDRQNLTSQPAKADAVPFKDPIGSGLEVRQRWGTRVEVQRRIRLYHGLTAVAVSAQVTNGADQGLTEAFQGCDGAGRFLISDFGLIPRRLAISTSC